MASDRFMARDGEIPLLTSETVKLEIGDEIEGWIVGFEQFQDEINEGYLRIFTENAGMVKLSLSTMLKPLKVFVGKPLKIRIVCTDEQTLGGGRTLKHFAAFATKQAPPFGNLLAASTENELGF